MSAPIPLPAGVTVFERGWLSANNVLLCDKHRTTMIDSGYVSHHAQTLALVENALQGRALPHGHAADRGALARCGDAERFARPRHHLRREHLLVLIAAERVIVDRP
jgi:hypothetical protein